MAIQKIFKSSLPSFKYFFRNGVAAIFMNGRFSTDNKQLEEEMMEEIGEVGRSKSRNPYIYVDEAEPELDTEALTPLELIKLQAKEEARKELLAEMAVQSARALNASANVSSTDPANFAQSLNTTAKLEASMGTDVTLQALKDAQQQEASQQQEKPQDTTKQATAVPLSGLAAKLAGIKKG